MTPGQNQQPLDINRLQDVAVNLVYNVCGIITMPVEMALRPHYGSRYFPPMMMLFSIIMMLLLPFLASFSEGGMFSFERERALAVRFEVKLGGFEASQVVTG